MHSWNSNLDKANWSLKTFPHHRYADFLFSPFTLAFGISVPIKKISSTKKTFRERLQMCFMNAMAPWGPTKSWILIYNFFFLGEFWRASLKVMSRGDISTRNRLGEHYARNQDSDFRKFPWRNCYCRNLFSVITHSCFAVELFLLRIKNVSGRFYWGAVFDSCAYNAHYTVVWVLC